MSQPIRMSPSELMSKAKLYGQSSQRIEEILADLTNLQSELRGEWEGRAFDRFDDQFTELQPRVRDFAELMKKIENQLTKTADAMAQQDDALSRNFGLN